MKEPGFPKLVLFINSLIPLAMVGMDAFGGRRVNGIEFAVRATGVITVVFLLLSLTITPLRLFTGWNWLSHFRRMLGLFAFFYGVIHLLIYFIFQREASLSGVAEDVAQRAFIMLGMMALMLMVPLAVTSTNGMIKRMGARRWKLLHKLVYVSAIMGMIHFYMALKADKSLAVYFAAALGVLFAYRLFGRYLPTLKPKRLAVPQPQ